MGDWLVRKLRKVPHWVNKRRYLIKFLEALSEDFFETKDISLNQKLWAYKRGFLSYRIKMYGLNEKNYKSYLSDFDYYRLQPINGEFHIWIDDKLTMKYILSPFNEQLPKYYYQFGSGGRVIRLMDCPDGYGEDLDDIVRLMEREGCLAAKLISGSRGIGFYQLAYRENSYFINNRPVVKKTMITFLQTLDKYILTEYLYAHKDLSRIWDGSANAIRIVAFRGNDFKTHIAGAYLKFGTQATGPVDNISAGGISATVDIDSGYFSDGRAFINDEMLAAPLHPNTKVPIEGIVPFWDEIKATLLSIGSYIPQIAYMGYDIVIYDDGFKIIEINSQPAIDTLNYYCPIYTNDKFKEFFKNLINKKSKCSELHGGL